MVSFEFLICLGFILLWFENKQTNKQAVTEMKRLKLQPCFITETYNTLVKYLIT